MVFREIACYFLARIEKNERIMGIDRTKKERYRYGTTPLLCKKQYLGL
jgi:hypothetical protein